MRQVTRNDFFARMNHLDINPSIVGHFPYTSLWKLRNGEVIGKTVDYFPQGSGLTETKYFLCSEA